MTLPERVELYVRAMRDCAASAAAEAESLPVAHPDRHYCHGKSASYRAAADALEAALRESECPPEPGGAA